MKIWGLLFQWNGTAYEYLLESGPTWRNYIVTATDVVPGAYLLNPIWQSFSAGTFSQFARTPEERAFFRYTTQFTYHAPYYAAAPGGYHSGNQLLCMITSVWRQWIVKYKLVNRVSCHEVVLFLSSIKIVLRSLDVETIHVEIWEPSC